MMKLNLYKLFFCAAVLLFLATSCVNEYSPGQFYTFTGNTVGSFLETEHAGQFDMFIEVLKRANVWGEMQTYGTYTCFAPDNNAFARFLEEKSEKAGHAITIDSLSDPECDTIAYTHLLNTVCYTTDLVEGSLPVPNMLDRYLTYSFDSIPATDSLPQRLVYCINKSSVMLELDDSVENGVVHIINQVLQPSSDNLPDVLKLDSAISIFYSALVETRMCDSLVRHIDLTYKAPQGDSCIKGVLYHTADEWEYAIFPEKRYFKFTAFVEPNSVYRAAGINNLDDLKAYAKQIYDESYPDDAGKYDDDPTNRRNPLNRFVSYHLLEYYGGYNDWNVTNEDILGANFDRTHWDVEDFFETMLPHSMVRICTTLKPNEIWINRKGAPGKVTHKGVRIYKPSESNIEQTAVNGIYHYIDNLLTYDFITRNEVLNTRMRYDCTTTSPDFVNSGGRNRPGETTCTGFKNGFCKNWSFTPQTLVSVRNRHFWFWSYQGDEVILQGMYDATLKLPPVPFSGTYEVRVGYPSGWESRGVIQAYLNGVPCDIPLDLRISGLDPKVGWVAEDGKTDEQIRVIDKAMHNRGYLKGPASYGANSVWFRTLERMLRRVITTQYMDSEQDYYLRVRQVLDNNMAEMVYDYIELVPKSVFASPDGEDIW